MPSESSAGSPLPRRLGGWGAAALVASNMLGVGAFASTGLLAGELGDPLLILAVWVFGAALAMAGGLAYAELAVNLPRSGGEYLYLHEAYGPAWGFAAGWLSLFAGFSGPIAAAALIAAEHLGRIGPIGPPEATALTAVAFFTALNLRGLRVAGRVQTFFTIGIVAVTLGFACAIWGSGAASWEQFFRPGPPSSSDSLTGRLGVSLIWVMFSLSGWNAAAYVAGEIKAPERNLPRAILLGAGFTALLYLALNVSFLAALPTAEMSGAISVGALVAERAFGESSNALFNVMVACTMLASVSAMAAAGPRVYYAMAENGDFFRFARRVDRRGAAPRGAVIAQGLAAGAMVFLPFEELLSYMGVSLTACTALTVLALFRLRRRPSWRRLDPPGLPAGALPACFLAVSLLMMFTGAAAQPGMSLLAAAVAVSGGLLYHRGGRRAVAATSHPARPRPRPR